MTPIAQDMVISQLSTQVFNSKYRTEILRIIKFIRNGQGSDGKTFLEKMHQTDSYRNQSFATTHPEIAKAMGYD
jgi:hypothetical protein